MQVECDRAREDAFAVSVVSIEELTFGIARAPVARRSKLTAWLDALVATAVVVPVTLDIARAAGGLRAVRETRGRRVTQADVLIAATAHAHGLAVVMRNERNFEGCGVDILNPFS